MPLISADALRNLTQACFVASGCSEQDAQLMAQLMVLSNLRGHDSHGIRQLPRYLDNLRKGITAVSAEITVITETPATALIDVNRSLGHLGACRAMEMAIDKARESRISAVAVRNLDHIGRIGAYPEMAAAKGMVGLCFTSVLGAADIVTPYGGVEGRYGTNPIAAGFPLPGEDPILLDFATSVVAANKVYQALDRDKPAEKGWLTDRQGKPSSDPGTFRDGKTVLLPLGGQQGYKGYGLAVLVEILGGILSGSGTFAGMPDREKLNNASFMIAIDPEGFVSRSFYEREIRALAAYLRETAVPPDGAAVMLPGEYEAKSQQSLEAQGIQVELPTWESLCTAAESLGVPIPLNKTDTKP